MKKYNKEFYIVYKVEPIEFYGSAIGVDELSEVLGRSRTNTLRALKNEYIKINNKKYMIIRETDLQRVKK
jgi:hypothetical protein